MAGDFRIDILGRPPRVGKFSEALSIAESAVMASHKARIVIKEGDEAGAKFYLKAHKTIF